MAPRRIGAGEHHEIGGVEISVALRHDVGAERAAVAGDGRGHAQPRVGVDVRCADEALRQLVGDVVVLGQQLPREIERDGAGAVLGADALQLTRDVIERGVPADISIADARRQQPRLEAERFAERRSLRAQPPEVGGMPRVAGDRRTAGSVRLCLDATADATVRARRAHAAVHLSPHQ